MIPVASPAAALRAADACRAAAAALRDCTDDRARQTMVARAEWTGPRRDAFDTQLSSLEREAARLLDHMLRLAGALDDVAAVLRRDAGGGEGW